MGWEFLRSWLDSLWYKISSIFLFQKELSIAIIGLQNSGKTTFTHLLGGERFETDTIPTLGIQINQFSLQNNLVKVYDLGGQTRFQPLWERCFDKADLIIYMIDLSDMMNLEESFAKLSKVIQMTDVDRIPLLVVGNKIDLIADTKESVPIGSIHAYDYANTDKLKIDSTNLHLLKNADILSRQLGIDLNNRVLHIPLESSQPDDDLTATRTTKELPLDRDIAVFTVSCKSGLYVQDIIDWIAQL